MTFSPYNIRLYRQTYFGICRVLAPLVQDGLACVLPMQMAAPDKPWLLEICPACTLKRASLYWPYKGKSRKHQAGRERILEAVEDMAPVCLAPHLRTLLLDDPGGDALDSLLAAIAVFRAFQDPSVVMRDSAYSLEGYVYV